MGAGSLPIGDGSWPRGGLCPGVISVRETPLYGKERAACILLERFLVDKIYQYLAKKLINSDINTKVWCASV